MAAVWHYIALSIILWCSCVIGQFHEASLVKKLTSNYQEIGIVTRPVANASETLRVSYGLTLLNVLNVNDAEQSITLKVWEKYSWNDIHLKWNPADYGGVDTIRIPASRIWQPDLTLYNAIKKTETESVLAVVTHDGSVLMVLPSIFHASCSLAESHHKVQETCILKFGSWTYDGFKLDLDFFGDNKKISLDNYVHSAGITLTGTGAKKNVKYYPCCAEPYPDLTFNLTFSREDDASAGVTFGVMACLSVVALVVFWMPPSLSARITLGANILIGLVLTFILAAVLPPAGKIMPEDWNDLINMMIATCVLIGCSVIPLILHEKGKSDVSLPEPLRAIFVNILGRVFCVENTCPPYRKSASSAVYQRRTSQTQLMTDLEASSRDAATKGVTSDSDADVLNSLDAQLQRISASVLGHQRAQMNKSEWRIVAQVCDRLFFILFTIIFVIILLSDL